MASRKSSRSTSKSTTVRRENLLRSVTELRPGRMSTNGLFRLGSQTLTEVNQRTGRSRTNSYFLVRHNLCEALRVARQNPLAGYIISTYYNGAAGKTDFRVQVTPDTVSIGCKVFTGKDAIALKAWATKE